MMTCLQAVAAHNLRITTPVVTRVLALALLMCVSVPPVAAQTPLKIGFVNASTILEKAPQAEEARKRLEVEFYERDLALVQAQKAMRELEDRLIDEVTELDDTERRRLEREIRNQKRELKRMEEEFKEDFNLRRNEELGKLQRLIYEAIVTLAEQETFDLILNQDAVIHAGQRVDVTNKVLERLQ